MAEAVERLRAALAERYRIERELGSGGMATVYLAEDLKHHRRVAIKVLKPDLAAALGPERFLREIEIAAQLTHPHILPLHDSGQAGGFLYYVMPYVEGESLRVKLAREGEQPVGAAVRILRDVVDALAAAHKHGVVHRDIKPDNVLLLDNHAMVTDFGVAKAVSEATGRQQLTTAGVALGTPAYMAPEQAVADPHVDHRADIYAVGAMAYEILTGRPPFTGLTQQEVLAAHVTEAPEPVTTRRETVPPLLAELVMRCLAKKPADRWQTADELLHVFEGILTPTGGITPTGMQPVPRFRLRRWVAIGLSTAAAVAVLVPGVRFATREKAPPLSLSRVVVVPLENATGDPALDGVGALVEAQLVEGLQQTGLGQVLGSRTALLTASIRDTTRQYVASPAGARELARATGSGFLFTGRYLASGDSLQVELSIVDLTDLTEPARIPVLVIPRSPSREALQPLRERAMGALAVLLDPRYGVRYIPGLQAPTYAAYREFYAGADAFDRAEHVAALAGFRTALAADSTFFVAAVWAAYALFNVAEVSNPERFPAVDSVVDALRPRRAALGGYLSAFLARVQAWTRGDLEEALRQSETMARLAPKSPIAAYIAARSRVFVNRPRSAAAGLAALDFSRHNEFSVDQALRDLARALHLSGDHERELREMQRWASHPQGGIRRLRSELVALVALGRMDEVRSRLDELLTIRTQGGFTEGQAMLLAQELSWHGHRDLAREVAGRALPGLSAPDVRFIALTLLDSLAAAESLADSLEGSRPHTRTWEPAAFRGVLAALRGDHDRAAQAMAALAAVREPYSFGWPSLWMARIRAITGEMDEAVQLLRQAHSEGSGFEDSFHADPFLEPLRDHPGFQEFVRPKD